MSKFNQRAEASRRAARGPIRVPLATKTPDTMTYEGAPAYTREAKSELFLLAVVNMVGEQTFYENAENRDVRFHDLVQVVALADPEWLVKMIGWLRGSANMRSASIVAAAEMVRARAKAGLHGYSRQAVDAALQRADEPGELLGYWLANYAPDRQDRKENGLSLPKPLARGISDAVWRLYNEYGVLKYDTAERAVRFGDVIDLVKPTSYLTGVRGTWRGDLYKHLIDRRHGRDEEISTGYLPMILERKRLFAMTADEREVEFAAHGPELLQAAGMTWENLASWLGRKLTASDWAAMIPSMGYMALLRNLRNFDEADLNDWAADDVAARLFDPEKVAKSRQFPYRFLSAYMAVSSDRWREPLRRALQHSLVNVPALPGRTLVLVDTSASMHSMGYSERSKITPMTAGALFGIALAAKGEAVDLYGFANGDNPFRHVVAKGASVLRETERFIKREGADGHGTAIAKSVQKTYHRHDRVVIVTDMQTFGSDHYWTGNVSDAVPGDIPMYGFNMAGYESTVMAGRNRHELGGLTDATFRMIPLLERGEDAPWPWEM